jgi:hypothetical protein
VISFVCSAAAHFFNHRIRLNFLEIFFQRAHLNLVPPLLQPPQQVKHQFLLAVQQRSQHWQRSEGKGGEVASESVPLNELCVVLACLIFCRGWSS